MARQIRFELQILNFTMFTRGIESSRNQRVNALRSWGPSIIKPLVRKVVIPFPFPSTGMCHFNDCSSMLDHPLRLCPSMEPTFCCRCARNLEALLSAEGWYRGAFSLTHTVLYFACCQGFFANAVCSTPSKLRDVPPRLVQCWANSSRMC